jgi:hypothetical protein
MGVRSGRRTTIGGQFAPRLIEMLESDAYRVLSLSARRVIDRVEIELGHHGGNDNGRLPVTYDDFVDYGIDRHSVGPAIREAVALGFLEVTEHGCAGNAEFRSPNRFRLTYRPIKGLPGDGCSHEWRRIRTKGEAMELAKAARHDGDGRTYRPSKRRQRAKTNFSAGKTPISVRETPTENDKSPVRETPTTAMVGKPPLLSISRGGGGSRGKASTSLPPLLPNGDDAVRALRGAFSAIRKAGNRPKVDTS